jgi:hypothetical protein
MRTSKSGFVAPGSKLDEATDPIVMRPLTLKPGHCSMICRARVNSSSVAWGGVERGRRPDFDSSAEVLIWMKMFSGVVRVLGRDLERRVADLEEERVSMAYKLGMAAFVLSLVS